MSTNVLSIKQVKRQWHLVDAKDQTLGRLATGIAKMLMGKQKINYVPYLDNGDFVVVTNASKIKLTGKKTEQKRYVNHSGYPGGLRVEGFDKLIERRPDEVIRRAVWGMMPKTKLGKQMVKRLKVVAGTEHEFKNMFKKESESVNA